MAKTLIPLTTERLKALVHYDPDTGVFTAVCDRPRIKKGQVLGWLNAKGYLSLDLDYRSYRLNRLAFFYMTGSWPVDFVDHENRDKTDNRWVNLREADNTQNVRNSNLSKANTSGHKGVMWYAAKRKWHAQITVNRKAIHLGYFETLEDAVAARRAAEAQHFGDFAPSPAA